MPTYQNIVCPECAQKVGAVPRVNFMGFPIFHCPCCHRQAKLPLATARAVIYLVVAVLALGICVKILLDGAIPMIGIIPGLMIAALLMDLPVRTRARAARERCVAK